MQNSWARLTVRCLLLLSSISAIAQTPAQRALEQEPEIVKIKTASADFQEQQAIPRNRIDSPSAGQTIISGFTGLAAQRILMKQLKDRLELKAEQCGFCSRWQDELAELLRQQVGMELSSEAVFKMAEQASGSSTAGLGGLFGLGSSGTHWQDKMVATEEMRGFRNSHCERRSDSVTRSSAETLLCSNITDSQMYLLFKLHATKWGGCLRNHDWIKTDGQRIAYEECMKENDFITQICQQTSQPREGLCQRLTVINAEDVLPLRRYFQAAPVSPENEYNPPVRSSSAPPKVYTDPEDIRTYDLNPQNPSDMSAVTRLRATLSERMADDPQNLAAVSRAFDLLVQSREDPKSGTRYQGAQLLKAPYQAYYQKCMAQGGQSTDPAVLKSCTTLNLLGKLKQIYIHEFPAQLEGVTGPR